MAPISTDGRVSRVPDRSISRAGMGEKKFENLKIVEILKIFQKSEKKSIFSIEITIEIGETNLTGKCGVGILVGRGQVHTFLAIHRCQFWHFSCYAKNILLLVFKISEKIA